MRRILAPLGGAISFGVVCLLVIGALTWVTIQSLRVESEQRMAVARADAAQAERLALWQLDSRLFPAWGVENNRHYAHYFAFYAPYPLINNEIAIANGDGLQVPSPILTTDLPDWMTLHFQLDPETGWDSPQVCGSAIDPKLLELQADLLGTMPESVNYARIAALTDLRRNFAVKTAHEQLMKLEKQNPADSPMSVPLPYQMVDPPRVLTPPPPLAVPPNVVGQAPGGKERERTDRGEGGRGNVPGVVELEAAWLEKSFWYFFEMPSKPVDAAAANSFGAAPAQAMVPPVMQQTVRGNATSNPTGGGAGYDARNATSKKAIEETRNSPRDPGSANVSGANIAAAGLAEQKPGAPDATLRFKQEEMAKAAEMDKAAPEVKAAAAGPPSKPTAKKMQDSTLEKEDYWLQPDANRKLASKGGEAKDNKADLPRKGEERRQAAKIPDVKPPIVQLGPMRPVWLEGTMGRRMLVLVRAARLENKVVFQGVLLDWSRLQGVLVSEIAPQMPEAKLEPVFTESEPNDRRMTALPAVLEPGAEPAPAPAGWTTLRIGLALGWAAALAALAAVGFVGWTLIDLSERRIRFVSAVTHELRTPLTSLRLYTDLLSSGMISEEDKQKEYLRTIGGESERLNTLVENVLDFAKLEKRTVQAHCVPIPVQSVLEEVKLAWADRLANEGRELVVHGTLSPEAKVSTDVRIAVQILGTLLDNARKYSRDADEKRIWLWAKPGSKGHVVFEVEDRGPGVPASESGLIFKPFRRANNVTSTGGAGLGLALAKQWTALLGGTLCYRPADGGAGACFTLELPV